ncbi:MCE family protein [Saccharopolyspora hirsuta]|uniref:MCE family protein n=1 Tax=Saccharopolyspora hirsuta TaxID=1837 RepID=A0A5M7BHT5_SACHI|nr:MCE family protein [Saccharopolyspora hirsuta]KAA5827141.1 MCE family protein [Saccharopolyspora hirsuta]
MRGLLGPLVKGAVFLVVTVLATSVLAVTIANRGIGDQATYTARFTDATSLNPGDDVRMAGVRIGEVTEVEVADRRFAEVTFAVDARRQLSRHVTAAIRFRNVVGQRYLALDQGPRPVDGVLPPGGRIPLERTRPAVDLTAMFNGFKPLFQALSPQDVNQLSFEIVQVLQGEGGTVDSVLRHTASLTSALADRDRVIGEVVANLNRVLDTINGKGDQLGTLVTTTQQLVRGLAADAEPIGEAIGGLGELSSSTAALLAEGREPLRQDIVALGDLAKGLADNTPTFERFLHNLPVKYERLGRIASYGSWLNFYLCSVSSDAAPAPGGPPVGRPVEQARCLR